MHLAYPARADLRGDILDAKARAWGEAQVLGL